MNIRITKGERKVTLTKRELNLLRDAKALCAELANTAGGDIGEAAGAATQELSNTIAFVQMPKEPANV